MLMQVMIHLGMQEIPAGNILKRWTVDARDTLPIHLIEYENDTTSELFIVAMKLAK